MQNDSREKRLFIKTQHAINKHESAILRQRQNTALDKTRNAAHILKHKYGCRKVILYDQSIPGREEWHKELLEQNGY